MQIVRFDAEVSVPIDAFGSSFRLAPLTAPGGAARLQVAHLPPGGLVGRHPAVGRQLFAVVAGDGWVAGGDGRRRRLRTGYGAVWEPGEEHEAGTDGGLTALVAEGSFEVVGATMLRAIEVVDADPAWAEWFADLHRRLWPAVADLALRIDHVGSTSVPGLAAKPIIDLDVVVADEALVRPVIRALAGAGYEWRGDLGIVGRQAFRHRKDDGRPPHHLYLVVDCSDAHLDHVLLRDLLRSDGAVADEYAALKRRNAELADGDLEVYVEAKAAFVQSLLARARGERDAGPPT